jgi:hypothetical protein
LRASCSNGTALARQRAALPSAKSGCRRTVVGPRALLSDVALRTKWRITLALVATARVIVVDISCDCRLVDFVDRPRLIEIVNAVNGL